MDFLYADNEQCFFMDPDSFKQVAIPNQSIGQVVKFLKEGMRITIELLNEEAVAIQLPKVVEVKVQATGPGRAASMTNTETCTTRKRHQNHGAAVCGHRARVDTDKRKYIDRVTVKRV